MTGQELTALKLKIAEAETAYHRLMLGGAVVEVTDQNGEKVRYAQANRSGLYSYIQTLKALLPSDDAARPTSGPPLRFSF